MSQAEEMQECLEQARKLLDELCAEPVPAVHSGWPLVTQDHVRDLYKLFDLIVRAKFEKDVDGDTPIDIKIIDRTRYYPDHYTTVQYQHKIENEDDNDRCLKDLLLNVKIATDALSKFLDIRDFRKHRQSK